jgi:transposase
MNYIGTDTHISTLEFKVVNNFGKIKKAQKVPTSAVNFMNFVKSVDKPRQVIIEEGPLAAWLLEICVQNGETLVITDPKQNHWIGSSGQKEDAMDAEKLAQLARGGYIKEIHHPVGQRRRFRELMQAYHDTNKSLVRVKNKIKAKFLQNGIQCPGDTVYSPKQRAEWQKKLPQEPTVLVIVDSLWRQLDQIEHDLQAILSESKLQAKRYPEINLIDEIPGVGFIIAATMVAILENPHRFANKKKVWSFAGFGIKKKSSAAKVYAEKLDNAYNRLLKCVVEEAAQAAVNTGRDNAFRRTYAEMTIKKGIDPHKAILTISRDIIATAWAMWKKGEHYNPEIDKQVKTDVEA